MVKSSLSMLLGLALWLLCAGVGGGEAAQFESALPEQLVQELGSFLPSLSGRPRSDGSIDPEEQRRNVVYARLRELGQRAVPALERGLADPDSARADSAIE